MIIWSNNGILMTLRQHGATSWTWMLADPITLSSSTSGEPLLLSIWHWTALFSTKLDWCHILACTAISERASRIAKGGLTTGCSYFVGMSGQDGTSMMGEQLQLPICLRLWLILEDSRMVKEGGGGEGGLLETQTSPESCVSRKEKWELPLRWVSLMV